MCGRRDFIRKWQNHPRKKKRGVIFVFVFVFCIII
jgi:hypothetical protein